MKFFTVHEPPDAPTDRIDRAETLRFIGDGYVKAAVIFGPLWLLANQLWLAFLGYVGIVAVIGIVVFAFGLSPAWISLMVGALNIWLGFEAAGLQRWALERSGWANLGTVSGRTIEESERRFLEGWLPGQRMSREQEFISTVSAMRGTGDGFSGLAGLAGAGSGSGGGRLDAGARRWGWPSRWISGWKNR